MGVECKPEHLWTDHCRIIGSGKFEASSDPIHYTRGDNSSEPYYSTDSYTTNSRRAYMQNSLVRGAVIEDIGGDSFFNTYLVVNSTVDGIDNGTTGFHADTFQLHTTGAVDPQDNVIVYNLRATDIHCSGIFMRADEETPPNDIHTNIAFVNVLVEMREDFNVNESGLKQGIPFAVRGGWDHFLVWNCSFPYSPTSTHPTALKNASFRGNIFWALNWVDGEISKVNPDMAAPGNVDNNEFIYNHYFYARNLTPADSCTGTSAMASKNQSCPDFYWKAPDSAAAGSYTIGDGVLDMSTPASNEFAMPTVASGLRDRIPASVVTTPADLWGNPRSGARSLGAIEGQSSSTEIRADVDQNSSINSTDAMLTLRNSLGLTMSDTNWQASGTTGDVNCDSNSNTTDASLILRSSLGLSMSGTGWCVT